MKRLTIYAALALLALLCVAASGTGPAAPARAHYRVPGAHPMAAAQAEWRYLRTEHDSAEACVAAAGFRRPWYQVLTNVWQGRRVTRDFDRITWLTVPGSSFRVPGDTVNSGYLIGLWVRPDTIYVAAAWLGSWVPKHEMIHDLLQRDHWDGDTAVWGTACHAMWGYLR